jgi:hypothetical protein
MLWDADVPITLRIAKPDSLDIRETFNAEPEPDTCPGELVFSRFTTPGYLGLIFSVLPDTTVPVTVTIMITAEDGSGLSEVYEKQVMLFSYPGKDLPVLQELCPQMENERNSSVQENISNSDTLTENAVLSEEFEKIFRQTERISTDLKDEFEIEGRALTLLCHERKLKFDQIIVPKKTWPLPKTVKFTSVVPSRVEVTRIPDLRPVSESVVYTDDGYKLKLNFLSAGEQFLLSLEYDFPTMLYLEPMVELSCSPDFSGIPDASRVTCGISALLKYPEILARGEYAVTFRDFEFGIIIPPVQIAPEPDCVPVSAPARLLIPESDLHRYIEAKKDFTFNRAVWTDTNPDGAGGISPSRGIRVVIRTDLSTGKPAADGILSLRYRDLFLRT